MFRSNQEHWGPSGAESPVGGILEAIGETPLIRLDRYSERPEIEVWAKLESSNPAASFKDRSALRLITDALESGHIGPETTVIESTSGNLGVGLAQACRYLGLRLICVVDSRTHAINLKNDARSLGAEVRVVDRKTAGDRDLLAARLDLVREILTEIPDSYWPNQYENPSSATAHAEGTMREIDEDLEGQIDYLFVATSTTGTLRGCCDYLARQQRETKVVAVDAQGQRVVRGRARQAAAARLWSGRCDGAVEGLMVRSAGPGERPRMRRRLPPARRSRGRSRRRLGGWRRVGVRCGRSCDRVGRALRAAVR